MTLRNTGPVTSTSCLSWLRLGDKPWHQRSLNLPLLGGKKNQTVWCFHLTNSRCLLFEYLEATGLTLGRSNILDVIVLALRSIVLVVFYCSVTNFHKLSCFKQYPLLAHTSVSEKSMTGFSALGLLRLDQGVGWLCSHLKTLGGKSISTLIQVAGRSHFFEFVGLRSPFPFCLWTSRDRPHSLHFQSRQWRISLPLNPSHSWFSLTRKSPASLKGSPD